MNLILKVMTRGIIFLVLVTAGSLWFFWMKPEKKHPVVPIEVPETVEAPREEEVKVPEEPEVLPAQYEQSGVPFTVQAPYGEWADPVFQDACEEASSLMAQAWVTGDSLTREHAKQRIQAAVQFQQKIFGHAVDTSIEDTERMLREFFSVTTTRVVRGVTIADIQAALASGELVIVPTDGRKLHNPNFKQPGPPRHMLVITGYSTVTSEFIVNDPGTRLGEGYRYQDTVLYEALLDYPTGKHAPVTSTDKVMLAVSRE